MDGAAYSTALAILPVDTVDDLIGLMMSSDSLKILVLHLRISMEGPQALGWHERQLVRHYSPPP